MNRRTSIPLMLAVVLVTSGCVAAVTGDTITFEASPATVAGDVAQANGFEQTTRDTFTANRTVDLPYLGERDVRITNHIVAYSRSELGDANGTETTAGAVFVLSTPQAKVAGQGTNPLGRAPTEELVKRFASRAGSQSDVESVGSTELTVLGETTRVEKFSSTTETDGRTVKTYVYVARIPHGDDYVIAVGMLPQRFADDESAIYAMMEGIEHDDGSGS